MGRKREFGLESGELYWRILTGAQLRWNELGNERKRQNWRVPERFTWLFDNCSSMVAKDFQCSLSFLLFLAFSVFSMFMLLFWFSDICSQWLQKISLIVLVFLVFLMS